MAVALPAGRQINGRASPKDMYFVYILISKKDNKLYTGITNNIEERLRKHNHGYKATESIMSRDLFELVFTQEYKDRKEARVLEKFFESGYGREIRKGLLQ